MVTSKSEKMKQENNNDTIQVIQLWKLPDDFFQLPIQDQFHAIDKVTTKAIPHAQPRPPCPMSLQDEAIAIIFFLMTLALPLLGLPLMWILVMYHGYTTTTMTTAILSMTCVTVVLAFHPLPVGNNKYRHSKLSLALIRYFTMEILLDRSIPDFKELAKPSTIETTTFQEQNLPLVCLACPHGVFNYGAIIWCTISRWICGWEQNTGAAGVVPYVPGIRYMDPLIWSINADRRSIKRTLQQRGPGRRGGMLGMVPDGILGAFRSRHGVDELVIGKKRGLMRICAEEGATIYTGWFFGTNELLTVVQDPWGIMESISRKIQAGMMGFYGRWYLPIPRRVAITQASSSYRVPQKIENPTKEQVEHIHQQVYGGLQRVYDQQKAYAGYPDETLHIQ